MKKCTWCGKEYPDNADLCSIDRWPLEGGEPPARPVDSVTPSKIIDLSAIEGAFDYVEGFSRPDWKIIAKAIEQAVSSESAGAAWAEGALQWTEQLRSELGGEYHVERSREFILLSFLEPVAAGRFLEFAERTLKNIETALKDAVWKSDTGPHVVLLFGDEDDYYQYLSYFYDEGVHPASGGCLIGKGYAHIAILCLEGTNFHQVLTHELVHNSVVHLPLPRWLNEGLAVVFDRTAVYQRRPIIDHDLRDRHLTFWNPGNIQKFWSGVSFGEPGDSNHLSYSLAEIIVNLLLGQAKDFVAFVKLAHRDDAGQTAALDILGADLGMTMATFLGEGNWRPNRKAMVDCWNSAKPVAEKPDGYDATNTG